MRLPMEVEIPQAAARRLGILHRYCLRKGGRLTRNACSQSRLQSMNVLVHRIHAIGWRMRSPCSRAGPTHWPSIPTISRYPRSTVSMSPIRASWRCITSAASRKACHWPDPQRRDASTPMERARGRPRSPEASLPRALARRAIGPLRRRSIARWSPLCFDRVREGIPPKRRGRPPRDTDSLVLESYLRLQTGARGDQASVAAIADSFLVADVLRVAMTDRAVAASVARAHLPSAELADLARREQDTQQQIGARQAALVDVLSRPSEQQSAADLATARDEIGRLKEARTVLTLEMRSDSPITPISSIRRPLRSNKRVRC